MKGMIIAVPELLKLFLLFARVGITTFGGGMAMLPVMMTEFVTRREWITDVEFADMSAVGQCTPGIIAVNLATFIGTKRKGTIGGIVSTLGMVAPSMVIITIIAAFLNNFAYIPAVEHAFAGVRVAVCAVIIKAIAGLWKSSVKDLTASVLFAVVLLLAVVFGIHPAILAIAAGVFGVVIGRIRRREAK